MMCPRCIRFTFSGGKSSEKWMKEVVLSTLNPSRVHNIRIAQGCYIKGRCHNNILSLANTDIYQVYIYIYFSRANTCSALHARSLRTTAVDPTLSYAAAAAASAAALTFFDDEASDALVPLGGVGIRKNEENVRLLGVRNPLFLSLPERRTVGGSPEERWCQVSSSSSSRSSSSSSSSSSGSSGSSGTSTSTNTSSSTSTSTSSSSSSSSSRSSSSGGGGGSGKRVGDNLRF